MINGIAAEQDRTIYHGLYWSHTGESVRIGKSHLRIISVRDKDCRVTG